MATSLIAHSLGTSQLGRYIWQIRNLPPTGATVTGEVTDPDGDEVSRAPVELCPTGGGACVARFADDDGIYRATNLRRRDV